MRKTLIALFAAITVTLIISCANRGSGPQGGPMDVTPPQVVKYSPAAGCTQMKRKRIEITFDEIVLLKDASQKIVVSPPQRTPADIRAVSHKVIIEFADSLLDSTTYSIDFTDAIVDNNEGNKLDGFTYCFSTGDYLDSLQLSGRVLRADNLNPSIGIIVGVHSRSHDSIFTTAPFSRISKTNERGEFIIRNLPPGEYSLFALSDIGSNFLKDMPGEEIAFLDTTFTLMPNIPDSLAPADILLMSFVEQDDRRFLDKVTRPDRYRLQMLFTGSDTVIPEIQPLNFPDSLFSHIVTPNATNDTLTFWLTDTTLWRQDTLQCLLSYPRRDFDSSFVSRDTVSFIYRYNRSAGKSVSKSKSIGRSTKKKESANAPKQLPKLATSNASMKFDVYAPFLLRFAMPTEITPHDAVSYHLQVKEDTVWRTIPGVTLQRGAGGTVYSLKHKWEPSTSYRFLLDSSLVRNMIGQTNGSETFDFTVKSLEEYSKLILHLTGTTGREIIQLLDSKDQVVREIRLAGDTLSGKRDVIFEYVSPGIYYLRLYSDDNGDGKWTPGLYSDHRQPEEIIYFPFDIELRAFWDVEEDWNPQSTRLTKPKELIKTETKK